MDQSRTQSTTWIGTPPTEDNHRNRSQFLLAMYKAMWDNINRHILVVWQSFAALFAAFAATYLSGKQLLSPDLGSALIVLAAGWSVAHTIDAAGWYNRNLLIIANIERQFLFAEDSRDIHYFFEVHRGARPIEHLMIQLLLAASIAAFALLDHFSSRVVPGFRSSWSDFEPSRAAPYILTFALVVALLWFQRDVARKYKLLRDKSPGQVREAASTAHIVPPHLGTDSAIDR